MTDRNYREMPIVNRVERLEGLTAALESRVTATEKRPTTPRKPIAWASIGKVLLPVLVGLAFAAALTFAIRSCYQEHENECRALCRVNEMRYVSNAGAYSRNSQTCTCFGEAGTVVFSDDDYSKAVVIWPRR